MGSKGIPRRKLHSDAIRGRSAETEERSGRALRLRGYPRRSVHIIFSSALVGRIRGNGPCSTVDHAIDKHGRQDKSIACRWLPCCACADPRCYLIRRRGGGHKDEAGAGKRGRLRVCHRGGGCHRIIEASLLLSLTPSFFFFFFKYRPNRRPRHLSIYLISRFPISRQNDYFPDLRSRVRCTSSFFLSFFFPQGLGFIFAADKTNEQNS